MTPHALALPTHPACPPSLAPTVAALLAQHDGDPLGLAIALDALREALPAEPDAFPFRLGRAVCSLEDLAGVE